MTTELQEFQEESKADEELAKIRERLKIIIANYNEYEEDTEELIGIIVEIKGLADKLGGRIKRSGFSKISEEKAKMLLDQANDFESTVKSRVKLLTEKKAKNNSTKSSSEDGHTSKTDLAKNINHIDVEEVVEETKYDSLLDLLLDLEVELDDRLIEIIEIIDESFIQGAASSKNEYYEFLQGLKDRIEDDFQ